MKNNKKPAIQAYAELQQAYDFFNVTLFDQMLPDMLITLQRGKNTFGYFAPDRFTGESNLSELAMNPDYFGCCSLVDTLSVLVHEMVHVWQYYTPGVKKCRGGYHDRVWGGKMELVGLMPSNTGMPGGKKTGQQMAHYIIRGGRFQTAVYDLLKNGFSISWYDKWCDGITGIHLTNKEILEDWLRVTDKSDQELINKLTKTVNRKNAGTDENAGEDDEITLLPEPPVDVKPPVKGTGTRTKFTCPGCGLNAWAKPSASLVCGECGVELEDIK